MWLIFILLVGGLTAVLVLAHWAVYVTLAYFLHFKNIWLQIIFLLAPLGFIITSLVGNKFNNYLSRFVYYISSAWLGLFNFLLIASILIWLFWLATKIFDFKVSFEPLLVILLCLSVIIFIYSLINANYLRVREYEVSLPNLPDVWLSRSAVWVSDLHLGQIRRSGFSRLVVEKINNLKPDLVFVGGDLFDGSAGDLASLAEPFKELKAPLGTYFITGNHEEFNQADNYLEVVKNLGMKTLTNGSVEIDDLLIIGVNFREGSSYDRFKETLSLIGANVHNNPNSERFKMAFSDLDRDRPMILLNHYPGNLDLAYEAGVNLQLSGHSHQGQIWPYNYITSLLYRGYDVGLKKYKDMTVITSAGAGTWGPPLRLVADPDIVRIKFVK